MSKRPGTYATVIGQMQDMSEAELLSAIEAELNSNSPRVDLLRRLAARFNRARGARFMMGVLAAAGAKTKGRKTVAGLL